MMDYSLSNLRLPARQLSITCPAQTTTGPVFWHLAMVTWKFTAGWGWGRVGRPVFPWKILPCRNRCSAKSGQILLGQYRREARATSVGWSCMPPAINEVCKGTCPKGLSVGELTELTGDFLRDAFII